MRSTLLLLWFAACGGNDVDPRVIPGGGIGDGAIDGEVNVHIIDDDDNPIDGATVRVGNTEQETDQDGLAVFGDVEGPQTITVVASGFRSTIWVGANGANVTIPITPLGTPTPDSATLSGSIPGWDTITVAVNHIKAALVFYSQTDDLGDEANNIQTPNNQNICGVVGTTCDWTVVTRTGDLTLIAAIIDRDTKGTIGEGDDTTEIIGWATRSDVVVSDGVNQNGLTLAMVEAGNLENLTVDLGTPPAGLPELGAFIGVEVSEDEVIQLPLFLQDDQGTLLAPKSTVFGAGATYRLTAIAQTTSGDDGAQSIVIRRGEAGPSLDAGEWLVPPTELDVTRERFSFQRVAGAKVHQVGYLTATDTVLEVTLFDATNAFDLPSIIELPSGTLTARVGGIGADLDVTNFSLEEDDDLLFGIAAEPTDVP